MPSCYFRKDSRTTTNKTIAHSTTNINLASSDFDDNSQSLPGRTTKRSFWVCSAVNESTVERPEISLPTKVDSGLLFLVSTSRSSILIFPSNGFLQISQSSKSRERSLKEPLRLRTGVGKFRKPIWMWLHALDLSNFHYRFLQINLLEKQYIYHRSHPTIPSMNSAWVIHSH